MSSNTPPRGRFATVEGLSIFVHTEGGDKPTVVFLPGAGLSGLDYWDIQNRVAASPLAVVYDRAGTGWSQRIRLPRTAQAVTGELHALLVQLGGGGPVILVGHSLGGLYARHYAARYPADVVGLVLIDPAHEDYDSYVPAELSENGSNRFLAVLNRVVDRAVATAPTRALLGLVPPIRKYQRLYHDLFSTELADWPHDLRDALVEQHSTVEWLAVGLQEARTPALYAEVRGLELPKNLRLILIASTGTDAFADAVASETTRRLAADEIKGRLRLYADLESRSDNAELRRIDAGHVTLPFRHPEDIVDAIRACE